MESPLELEVEAESRLKASRQRRAAQAQAWMERVRKEMSERMEFLHRKVASSTPAPGPGGDVGEGMTTTDRKEKMTLSLVSMEWREALKGDRCSFLFHQLFPHLFEGGYLSKPDILNFRLTSKEWKGSAEDYIASTLLIIVRHFRNELNFHSAAVLPMCTPVFISMAQVARVKGWSEGRYYSGQNPFFTRKVHIATGPTLAHCPLYMNNQEFWRGLEIIFRRWGTQLWQIQMYLDPGMTPAEVYKELHTLLTLTSNLRGLQVMDRLRAGRFSRLETDMLKDLGKDVFGPLKEEMKVRPLPELPYLTHICFNPFVPAPIVHAILSKYNHQLKFVSVHHTPDHPQENVKVFRTISNCAPPAQFEGRFPVLEELVLKYNYVGEATSVPDIFQNVNDCGSSPFLRRLSLTVHNNVAPVVSLPEPILKSLSLELPHLERVKFCVSRVNLKNIDFLLPCRSLKRIHVRYTKNKKKGKKEPSSTPESKDATPEPTTSPGEVIKYTGYVNRMYESNVWELFPDLEQLSIEVSTILRGWGKGLGLPPVMRSGSQVVVGNVQLGNDSETVTKFYTRECYLQRQVRKEPLVGNKN